MGPAVYRDDANIVHTLVKDGHLSRSLKDFHSLVVFLRDARHRPGEAAVIVRMVFPGVDEGDVARAPRRSPRGVFRPPFLAPLSQGRHAAILRIDNQRGASRRSSLVTDEPQSVIAEMLVG